MVFVYVLDSDSIWDPFVCGSIETQTNCISFPEGEKHNLKHLVYPNLAVKGHISVPALTNTELYVYWFKSYFK